MLLWAAGKQARSLGQQEPTGGLAVVYRLNANHLSRMAKKSGQSYCSTESVKARYHYY